MSQPRYTTLEAWLEWQESLHGQEIDLGLERISRVYQRLMPDWGATRIVTVGGTNGKGSTIAFLNAIYQRAGYRVGQFTSPHFLSYSERIQIDSQPVDERSLCDAFALIDRVREDTSLTYFEFSTLAALLIFASQKLDVVLLEVGLGGRLDASNLVDADCSIVTSVGIDHRDWLGDTREQIGFEKAGIYRPLRPAICGDRDIPASVRDYARSIDAQWYGRGSQFKVQEQGDNWYLCYQYREQGSRVGPLPRPSMLAPVQMDNAACAVLAVTLLQSVLPVDSDSLGRAVRTAAVPGRMQVQRLGNPFGEGEIEVILDVAHNEDAARSVQRALAKRYAHRPVRLVLGMLADKEVAATLEALQPLRAKYYISAPQSPRAMAAGVLAEWVVKGGGCVSAVSPSIEAAYRAALEDAGQERKEYRSLILVMGSFFTVSEVMGLSSKAEV